MDSPSAIVDPTGRPARKAAPPDVCPQCGKGEDTRRASSGYGIPWTVCECGFEWKDRVFRG